MCHQIMCEGALLGLVLNEHFDDLPHAALDLNHKHLVLIAKKHRLAIVDRQDTPYFDRDHLRTHAFTVGRWRFNSSAPFVLRTSADLVIASLESTPQP